MKKQTEYSISKYAGRSTIVYTRKEAIQAAKEMGEPGYLKFYGDSEHRRIKWFDVK